MNTRIEAINTAFASDVKLRKRIFDAINETPQHAPLFEDIAKYQLAAHPSSVPNSGSHEVLEQPVKKRRLEDGAAAVNGFHSNQQRHVILEARDVSFTLPQRKKLHLNIVQFGQDFAAPSTTFAICAINPATSQAEFEYPISAFANAVRVPVPEKAQKQCNFCLLPAQPNAGSGSETTSDAIIWTINQGPLKSCQIHSTELEKLAGTGDVLENALNAVLQQAGSKLVYPTDAEFVSALVESHRKNEKAYHVKAFRGSKDGYLFFLENGIFFGFKKPLAFFPFHDIDSVSYTAVLQRTFNLVLVVRTANEVEPQEIEFSMLDQADFAGIDAYIKKHQLQDSSMAEARRARQFNVNGARSGATEEGDDAGQSELQKAEQELEDEEDEMEEDYDPGSEGESEGSGSSDDDDYEFDQSRQSRDLVQDELGSEAEDVELDAEEDEEEEEDGDEDEDEDGDPNGHLLKQEEEEEKQANSAGIKQIYTVPKLENPSAPPAPVRRWDQPDLDDEDQL